MKKQIQNTSILILLFSIIALFMNCGKVNMNYEHIVLTINDYDEYSKNEQLAKDLLFYKYKGMLLKKIDGLSQNDLNSIYWKYFIQEKTKEISFRVTLQVQNTNILKRKSEIISFFNEKVAELKKLHVDNPEGFNTASDYALNFSKMLADGDYVKARNHFNSPSVSKEQTDKMFKQIEVFYESNKCSNPFVNSRQFYTEFENAAEGKYYVVNIQATNDSLRRFESVVLSQDAEWEVVGFHVSHKPLPKKQKKDLGFEPIPGMDSLVELQKK